ncbi:MAG: hypothetical protein EAZ48_06300 [Flavobacteriia bacterium]|jgi:hypothetical protein|nr:MAG: hypothetical protein EAZ48_06300 [Flavobacteriia bacterium]
MQQLWFLCFSLFSFGVVAQELNCAFTDLQTKDAIPNVNCWLIAGSDTLAFASSKQNGTVSFSLNTVKPDQTEFAFVSYTHPFYIGGKRKIPFFEPTDTIQLRIQLKTERVQEVREVVLKPNKPDTVFASKTYSVADFELDADGTLILLTYEKNLQKDAQLQVYKDRSTAAVLSIPERAQVLKRDFRGNIHVLTAESVFGLEAIDSNYTLVNIPKDYFFKYLVPIVDSSQTRLFYSNYNDIYPAFEYGSVDQLDSTYKTLLQIQDDLMMELYRSEYKWVDVRTKLWAKNLENQTGIDAEIYVGAAYFTQSLYYEPVYAPLFLVRDTIYIFDYPKDMLRVFLSDGTAVRTIPIFHHYQARQSGFQRNLQQDRQTGKIYAVFEQEGHCYVGLIDLQTGMITQKVKLSFRYVEKVRVHNNEVYFIYRPFESTQKKFLYKQKLPVRTEPR